MAERTDVLSKAMAAAQEIHTTIPSRVAADNFHFLHALDPEARFIALDELAAESAADVAQVWQASLLIGGTRYALYDDSPVRFTMDVLGESVWSIQQEILTACAGEAKSIIVPAGFSLGKTHVAAYACCWFASVNPVGTALTVTTATRFRQVQRQLWPHVRRLHAKARLPGECDTTQWKMPSRDGVETIVAYGFTAPENDEAAMQGIHAPRLLLIVDEAGGIGRTIGSSTRNLLTGKHAKMLAIGNPPTDDEDSWFEGVTSDGLDEDRRHTITIRIPAAASPAITLEYVRCLQCPPEVEPHSIGEHLVDQEWVNEAIREHGEDSPYVIAKVKAEFPRGGASRAIPGAFIDAAVEAMELGAWWGEEYAVEGQPSVDRQGEPYKVQPPEGAIINLGVDVAADGGDEFVIARQEGDVVRIRLVQSGAANENANDVAGKILEEIHLAEQLREALGTERAVHVKVDAIGVGWGVVSTLEAWGSEGLHDSVIVRVIVSELPDKPDDKKAQWRPANKRAEMWLNGREQFKPDGTGRTPIRLDVGAQVAAQLRGPEYGTNTAGRQVIERKVDMKSRGLRSPDRGEACLLAIYDVKSKRRARVLA